MIARVARTVVVCFVLMGVAPSVVGQGSEGSDFAHLRDLAAQGNVAAQVLLGLEYEAGNDYAEAVKWLRKAADQGGAQSQVMLGAIYLKGEGVPQDYAEAATWLRKAADQGDAQSQVMLGGLYVLGKGVPQDYVQAHLWSNLAGASGDAGAVKMRDLVAAEMTPAQIAEAQKLAREWKPKQP